MKLDIQSIHFDADEKLLDFIQKKCDKLEKIESSMKKLKNLQSKLAQV